MRDKQIVCTSCGRSFPWSEGEQRFYKERHLSRPKRCKACRTAGRSSTDKANRSTTSTKRKPDTVTRRARSVRRLPANPYRRHYMLGFGATFTLTLLLWLGGVTADVVTAWLVAINGVTFCIYGYDKAIAKGRHRRVPERVLLVLALSFGALGALIGMRLFRHKTAKTVFQRKFWLVVVLQVLLVWVYFALTASP